jgi:3-oxoadipate CoA-transferase beta subunit
MDLAIGAKQTFVMMELFTKDGACKLVEACSYPITGIGCVSRVYTDHGVFEVGSGGGRILELIDGLSVDAIREMTGLGLIDARETVAA